MKVSKKILSVLMSLILAFSFITVALADDGTTCAHSLNYWRVEREATPEYSGLMVRWCSDCQKEIETKNFEAHEHTPGYEEILVAPYCETAGQAGVVCADCGAVYETKEIPALGHSGSSSTTTTVIGGNLEVVFLIDESGSMSSNDPSYIRKQVAKELTDNFGTSDKAAVVAFDSYTRVITDFTSDKEVIKNAIDQVSASGGTDMYEGLEVSIGLYDGTATAKRYIVLLTDGQSSGSFDYATAAKEKNVVIYTVGLGYGVNSTELEEIATATGGSYYYADAPEDLFGIYEEITEEIVTGGGTWVTTVVPTCSSFGERVCYCSRCGLAIASEKLEPVAHTYSAAVYLDEDTHTGTCVDCGMTVNEGHAWTGWMYNNDNTFFTDGTMSRYCVGCAKEETVTAEHTSIIGRIFYPFFNAILSFFNEIIPLG